VARAAAMIELSEEEERALRGVLGTPSASQRLARALGRLTGAVIVAWLEPALRGFGRGPAAE
jgi:hypothetical protein